MEKIKNLFKKSIFKNEENKENAVWFNAFSYGSYYSDRVQLSLQQLFNKYRDWFYCGINVRARDLSAIEFKLYEYDNEGQIKQEIKNHEILDCLYGKNNNKTKTSLIDLYSRQRDIFGEHFWYIDKDKNINILQPNMISYIFDSLGQVKAYKYYGVLNGVTFNQTYSAEEIICFKDINPFNPEARGYSIIQGIYEWLEMVLYANERNSKYFKNNATPDYLFISKTQKSELEKKRFLDKFNQEMQGVQNSFKMTMLTGDVEVHKVQDSIKDMDFYNLDIRFQDKILSALELPKTRLFLTENVQRANMDAANYQYSLRSLKPRMDILIDVLNEKFLPMFNNNKNICFDYVNPVPEDIEMKIKLYQAALAGQPWMSINEIRKLEFLEPKEGGDDLKESNQYYQPFQQREESINNIKDINNINKSILNKKYVSNSQRIKTENKLCSISENIGKEIVKNVGHILLKENIIKQQHKDFINRNSQYIKIVDQRMKSVNNEIYLYLNDNLEKIINRNFKQKNISKKAETETTETTEINFDDEDIMDEKEKSNIERIMFYYLGLTLSDVFYNESKQTLIRLGRPTGHFTLTEQMKKLIDSKIKLLSDSYTDTTKEIISTTLKNAIENNLTREQIKEEIKKRLEGAMSEERASTVATTETYRMSNLANKEIYKTIGLKKLTWHNDPSSDVCQFCKALDGKEVDINDPFLKKGQTIKGVNGGEFNVGNYDNIWAGNLHPECKCWVSAE